MERITHGSASAQLQYVDTREQVVQDANYIQVFHQSTFKVQIQSTKVVRSLSFVIHSRGQISPSGIVLPSLARYQPSLPIRSDCITPVY